MQLQFFLPELILHKYSVEGYAQANFNSQWWHSFVLCLPFPPTGSSRCFLRVDRFMTHGVWPDVRGSDSSTLAGLPKDHGADLLFSGKSLFHACVRISQLFGTQQNLPQSLGRKGE